MSQIVLILTSALLFYVALTDLRHYKIKNEVVLVLAGLFFVYILIAGNWVALIWNFLFAALLFFLMLYFYSLKLMGGGDLKLLTVAFLWVGPFCAVPFALFLLFFVGVHTLAVKLKLVETQGEGKKKAIAFAPSIAGALIAVFMVGCLNDGTSSFFYGNLGIWLHRLIYELMPWIPHDG